MNKIRISCVILIVLMSFFQFSTCLAYENPIKKPLKKPLKKAPQTIVAVLAYHDIVDNNKECITNSALLSVYDFNDQMAYLFENKFNIITMQQLEDFVINKKPLPPKSVMITFDDGYNGVFTCAYPILKQYNYHATIFLTTCRAASSIDENGNEKPPYLNPQDIEVTRDVFEYGFHTHKLHIQNEDKVSALLTESVETLNADLEEGKKYVSTKYFAFPYGQFDTRLLDFLRDQKFTMAFSIRRGYVHQSDNPFCLNRFPIFTNTTMEDFCKIVNQTL